MQSPPAVHAAVDLSATAIHAAIDGRAATVEAPIHSVTLAIQAFRQPIPAGRVRPSGLAIEPAIDAVATVIEAVLDTIALAVETILDTIARIGQYITGAQQQSGRDNDSHP